MSEIRIKLGEPALRALCRGGEVTVVNGVVGADVKLILEDIGFGPMSDCVDDAIEGKDHYKPVRVNSDGMEIQ